MKRLYLLSIVLLLTTSAPVVHAMDEGKSEAKTEKAQYKAKFYYFMLTTTAAEQMAILSSMSEADRAVFVQMRNKEDCTALFNAQSGEVVDAILSAVPEDERANVVRIQDNDGNTALFQARPGVVAAILSAVPKADRADVVKIQNKFHRTALFDASSREAVDAILSAVPEADRANYVNKKNLYGSTALCDHITKYNIFKDLCNRNSNRNKDLSIKVKDAIIQLLTVQGIDIYAEDNRGRTARELNPKFFDECVTVANKIIEEKNAGRRAASIDALVAKGMARDVANMVAQYDEQPLIEISLIETPQYTVGGHAENPGPAYSCKHQEHLFKQNDWVIVKRSSGAYTYGRVEKLKNGLGIKVDRGLMSWSYYPEIYRIPSVEAPEKGAAAAGEAD